MLTADTPFAKVFTIVCQEAVAILADPQASATDHFVGIEPGRSLQTDPNGAPLRKLGLGNLLDWTSTQPARQAAVLDDASLAYVDAMVGIPATRRDQVRTDRWLALRIKRMI